MYSETNVLEDSTKSSDGAILDNYYVCLVAHQIKILARTQGNVLIRCKGNRILTVETYRIIPKHRGSVTAGRRT